MNYQKTQQKLTKIINKHLEVDEIGSNLGYAEWAKNETGEDIVELIGSVVDISIVWSSNEKLSYIKSIVSAFTKDMNKILKGYNLEISKKDYKIAEDYYSTGEKDQFTFIFNAKYDLGEQNKKKLGRFAKLMRD